MNEAKATFWLSVARAWLPPQTPQACEALRTLLPGELEELAAECGYPIAQPLAAFAEAVAPLSDEALLVSYSRLFLVPGDEHPTLNPRYYLDGTLYGTTVQQLLQCYRTCGLEKSETLHDLPDHITVPLEFAAFLFAALAEAPATPPAVSPEAFFYAFISRWSPHFCKATAEGETRFGLAPTPWLPLAQVLDAAAQHEAGRYQVPDEEQNEIAKLRAQYQGRQLTEADLEQIRAALQAAGVSADHVVLPTL